MVGVFFIYLFLLGFFCFFVVLNPETPLTPPACRGLGFICVHAREIATEAHEVPHC